MLWCVTGVFSCRQQVCRRVSRWLGNDGGLQHSCHSFRYCRQFLSPALVSSWTMISAVSTGVCLPDLSVTTLTLHLSVTYPPQSWQVTSVRHLPNGTRLLLGLGFVKCEVSPQVTGCCVAVQDTTWQGNENTDRLTTEASCRYSSNNHSSRLFPLGPRLYTCVSHTPEPALGRCGASDRTAGPLEAGTTHVAGQ